MIREARPQDAEAIGRVHVETWRAAYRHVFPRDALASLSVEQRSEQWRGWIEGGGHEVLVAEQDGEIRGFASAGPSPGEDEAAELHAIYVEPSAWGSGLGRKLIVEAERRLRDAGFGEATLWVLADNPRARAFYEAGGWRLEGAGTQTFLGVEVDVVRYRKAL